MNSEAGQREKTERRPWRLRTRLGLTLFVGFIPIVVLVAVSHIENLRDRRDARVESFETIGQTTAAVVDGFTRDLSSLAITTSLALGDANIPLDQQTVGPYLARIAESYGILRGVFITDLNGKVVASQTGEANGTDLSNRNYIQALQKGSESIWSGAIAGSQSGQTTMAYATIIRSNDGKPRAYFVIAFYPSQLIKRLPDNLPDDADVSLIDEHGLVLYSSSDPDAVGQPRDVSKSSVFIKARQGQVATLRSESSPVDDGAKYGSFAPVPATGWVVGYTRPASAIDGPLRDRFWRDLLIVCLSIGAGFIFMIIASSRLSRPLSRFAAAAAAIARGERPVIYTASADAEVRQLEVAMDTMSRAVADRQERLAAQARVLETLERVGQAMATELDFEKAVISIMEAAAELTQADAVGLFFRPAGGDNNDVALLTYSDHPRFPISADGPLVSETLRGEVVDIPDLLAVQRENGHLDAEGSLVARSCLGMPIYSRSGDVFGGLFLLQSRPEAFDDYQRRLAMGLARRAGVVLENARLYSRAREIQEELEQANRSKTEFIGLMSHELRTPLTTIYGGARLLHTRRASLSEEDALELIESIEEESERLYRLIENLLALARADIGDAIARDVFPISPVVDQVVRQFVNRKPGRPVEVRLGENLPEGLPLVWAESTYVRQVIHNLVTNADKYSPPGTPIELIATAGDEEMEIRVLDRGPGVPEAEIERIFGSFFRSQTTARSAGGKGLGLTVVRRLVEAMDGRIWAQLREGGGLEVGFSLPLAGDTEHEAEAVAAAGTE
jgi:signal transduction histidine kinase